MERTASKFSGSDAAEIGGTLAEQTRLGFNLLSFAVAGLLLWVILKSSGMSWNLSVQDAQQLQQMIYEDLEERASGRSSFLSQLTWLLFGIVGLYLHFVNKTRALFTWARAWPLLVLLALILLSFLWSSVPDIAFRRAIKHLLLVAALAGVVLGAGSPRDIFRLAIVFTGVMMAINCASVVLLPGVAIDSSGDIKGMFGHKNTAGQFVLLSVLLWFVAARWAEGAWLRSALILGTVIWFLFLVGTDSRTSILTAVVSIACILPIKYCIRQPNIGILILLLAVFVLLCALFVVIGFNITLDDFLNFLEGEKTTLTGRTAIWGIAFQVFLDHMLVGTGYGSLWSTGGLTPAEQYSHQPLTGFLIGLTQAHSGYFEVLATFGLVGVVAFLTFMASAARKGLVALAASDEDEDRLALAELTGMFLLASLIYNLTQTTFMQNDILWMTLLVCYLSLCSLRSPDDPETVSASEPASEPASERAPVSAPRRRGRVRGTT